MKISCNVKQGTSLIKNSSQTVKIKDKKNMPTNTKQQLCIKPTSPLVEAELGTKNSINILCLDASKTII